MSCAANDNLEVDQTGLDLTETSEGLSLKSYPDPGTGGAPWTAGWGHTGKDVQPNTTYTHDQCVAWLKADIAIASSAVRRLVNVPLTQDEFDALSDFTLNEGEGNLAGSTLLRKLNAGDYEGAAEEFSKWDLAAGRVLPGLVTRRAADAKLFRS